MNRYKIPCTEEQTKKALELGAPILLVPEEFYTEEEHFRMEIEGENASVILPTAEEMIGWLREMDIFINIIHIDSGYSSWTKTIKENETLVDGNLVFLNTYEESVLSAIDEALEYLSNKTTEE